MQQNDSLVNGCHQAGVLNRVTWDQFSASCAFLIKQANRPGISAASLSTRLQVIRKSLGPRRQAAGGRRQAAEGRR